LSRTAETRYLPEGAYTRAGFCGRKRMQSARSKSAQQREHDGPRHKEMGCGRSGKEGKACEGGTTRSIVSRSRKGKAGNDIRAGLR